MAYLGLCVFIITHSGCCTLRTHPFQYRTFFFLFAYLPWFFEGVPASFWIGFFLLIYLPILIFLRKLYCHLAQALTVFCILYILARLNISLLPYHVCTF